MEWIFRNFTVFENAILVLCTPDTNRVSYINCYKSKAMMWSCFQGWKLDILDFWYQHLKISLIKIDFEIWPIFKKISMLLGYLQSGKIDDENFPFLFQITKCMLGLMKKCTNINHEYFCNFSICLFSLPAQFPLTKVMWLYYYYLL